MSLYNPGNSVVVNLLMRWPVLTPVVAAAIVTVPALVPKEEPPPAPVVIEAPEPAPTAPPVPKELPPKKKIGG